MSVFDDSIFGTVSRARETNAHVKFTPNLSAITHISRAAFSEMTANDPGISKTMTPEMFDYYCVALLWLRIINLQTRNGHPVSDIMCHIAQDTLHTSYAVPKPILLFLKGLGHVESITKQRLYPTFPDLPVKAVGPHGGYHAATIDADSLQEFIEIPCLGVLAEAVRFAVSNENPGPYHSVLELAQDQLVNENLPGFHPLQHRSAEAKNVAFTFGVTAVLFPEDYPDTAWNTGLIAAISARVANSKTFCISPVTFSLLSEIGSTAQLINLRPQMADDQAGYCHNVSAIPCSLTKEANSIFGAALYVQYSLYRAASPGPLANMAWCPINHNKTHPIPGAWIVTLNARRNLPVQFQQGVFVGISQRSSSYRTLITKALAISPLPQQKIYR